MSDFLLSCLILLFGLTTIGCRQSIIVSKAPESAVRAELDKLAPVALKCDLSHLTTADRKTLAQLVKAAKGIDQLFLLQVDPHNTQLQKELENTTDHQAHLDLFRVMFGSWNRLEHDKPFINTVAKPAGAGFYPPDMSVEEFQAFVEANPKQAAQFESNFTVIRRVKGQLKAIPYHLAYQPLTKEVSEHLEKAAALTEDPSLKKFLELRAQALLTDDYYESDMAWMDLAGDLEIVIGPYEVYEDNLFNYKAAYEAFICIVDHAESEKLAKVAHFLSEMEGRLPMPDQYKNLNRGMSSPIKVVQEVLAAGDTRAGIQTTAFNLPNDERVREAKGSKKVMLKNIAQAKYEKCWIPIVNTVLAPKPLAHVSFDAYFNHVLMHEMSHGLGPGNITLADGTRTSVARELKELYSVIEECKADVLGVYFMKFLMDKGIFPLEMEYGVYASYLGGMLRSIRFGINEAHGGGVAIQFNYGFEKGAFFIDEQGKLDLREDKVLPVLTELAGELLMIQAKGDYAAARRFMEKYRVMSPVMQKAVDSLKHVPVDIRPSFPVLAELGME